MSKTKEGIEVKVGQVWERVSVNAKNRRHIVRHIIEESGDVLLVSLEVRGFTGGREFWGRIDKMHNHSTGWKLIKDVP